MKTPSTTLFDLIKSLTPNEKRYISIYEKIYGKNKNHHRLFSLLLKQEDYNEDKIKKELSLYKNNQLTVLKTYLYDLILKAMRNFHSLNSAKSHFENSLSDASFLFEKRLYNQAIAILTKIEPDLKNLEMWKLLHTAYQLRVNIMASTLYEKTDQISFNTFIDEMSYIEKQNLNYQSYYQIALRLHYTIIQGEAEGAEKAEAALLEIQKNILLQRIELCSTIKSKHFFYQANSSIESFLRHYKKSIFWMKKHINFLVEHPLIFNHNDVLSVSQNLFTIYSKTKNIAEAKKIIAFEKNIIENMPLNNKTSNTKDLFFRFFLKEIDFIIESKDFKYLEYFIRELNQHQKKHFNKVGYRNYVLIWFKVVYAYYLFNQLENANQWALKLLKVLDKKLERFLFKNLLIIQFILFIESDKKENALRVFKTLKRTLKEEDSFVRSFYDYINLFFIKQKVKNNIRKKTKESLSKEIKVLQKDMICANFIELHLKK